MTSTERKDLLDRMILLEKLIELKSNECAYYRTKVHLMQMNFSKEIKRVSSSDEGNSIANKSPTKSISDSSIPFERTRKSKRRSQHRTSAQNQNSHSNEFERKLLSTQDKNIQCNEKDLHPMDIPPTILKIRLPHRFVKSLLARPRKSSAPRLKVHLSSQLLNKLFQSIHSNPSTGHFTIQSQFGKFAACIDQKQQTKAIHAKAEVKMHSTDRLAIVRHIAQTRSEGSHRRKVLIDHPPNNSSKYRQKKRDFLQSSSTSKRSSMTNLSRTTETLSSTDQTSNSIRIENIEEKKRKISIKR